MDNPNINYRGSQRALKMLQAQKSAAQQPAKKPTERLSWPPKAASLSSLDPAFESSNPHPVATNSSTIQSVSFNRTQAVPSASTPIQNRIANSYNSPEASIPSNGGVTFNFENNMDLESSRLSNLPHSELLVADFNSNNGFSRTEEPQNVRASSSTQVETSNALDDCEFVNDDDETRNSMCFSFSDGKVTALVATADGAYCIAAFSSGAIRLFDLTRGGNTDPEDRFGYQIGFIETTRGSVQVQLALGSSVSKVDGSSTDCCHLFAGARQGSTTMLVVDIGSLREVHKKRGFISVAGGGVQVLSHSDARLKGLTSLSTVSCVRPVAQRLPGNSQEAAASNVSANASGHVTFSDRPESAEDRGYTASYRMITGAGFGNYHIWEVKLEARPMLGVLGSPAGNGASSGGGHNGLSYTQKWNHLFQGAVNGPTMNFAHFIDFSAASAPISATPGSASNATLSLWGQCQQRALLEPELSARAGKPSRPQQSIDLIVSDTHKDLRLINLLPTASETDGRRGLSSGAKPQNLKDTTCTYAASQDGTVLFGGKYELIVTVLAQAGTTATAPPSALHSPRTSAEDTVPAHGAAEVSAPVATPALPSASPAVTFAFRAVFSLNDFASGAIGRSNKKASRHLREISGVWCTPDGCYAIILCTDNAVLLYSVCDITGKSSYPTRTEGLSSLYSRDSSSADLSSSQNALNSGAGFLTYLFEAEDTCNLDLSIAYITTETARAQAARDRSLSHSLSHSRGHSQTEQTHLDGPACSCGIYSTRGRARHHHLPPECVLVSISWWLIENPMLGGVLKVCKLVLPTGSAPLQQARTALLEHVVPTAIATSSLVPETAEAGAGTGARRGLKAALIETCLLCGDASTKHWNADDLNEAEKELFSLQCGGRSAPAHSQPNQAANSSAAASHAPADKEKRPVKKKEAPREAPEAKPVAGVRDKRQKLSHSQSKERLAAESGVAFASPSDYFSQAQDVYEQPFGTEEIKRVSTETIDLCNDEPTVTRSRSATPANETMSQVPDSSQSADTDGCASNTRSNSVDYGAATAAAASPSTLTAKELRQELERLKAENRRLRIDTDLTMRKADRRFELEMVARRYWKREKSTLEGVIAQMQKEQLRWSAEKDKVKRLHVLLQDVLHTASATLQYSAEERGGDATLRNPTGSANAPSSSAIISGPKSGVFSPASRLLTDLSSVNAAYENGGGSVMNNTGSRGQSSGGYNGAGGGYATASNSGRKPFFCIVCLDHTARVAIQPCGHICFCTLHAEEMQRRIHDYHHSKCPLCQVKIDRFLTIQGIDMPESS